jgi:hypothetical protein
MPSNNGGNVNCLFSSAGDDPINGVIVEGAAVDAIHDCRGNRNRTEQLRKLGKIIVLLPRQV